MCDSGAPFFSTPVIAMTVVSGQLRLPCNPSSPFFLGTMPFFTLRRSRSTTITNAHVVDYRQVIHILRRKPIG
jgi:hypothetical protein